MVDVVPSGRSEQTYELAIDDVHEFFANGVVVANCSDAALYIFRHLAHHLARPAPAAETRLAREEREAETHAEVATEVLRIERVQQGEDGERDGWEMVNW